MKAPIVAAIGVFCYCRHMLGRWTRYDVYYKPAHSSKWDFWSTRTTWKQADESGKECMLRFPGYVYKIERRKP